MSANSLRLLDRPWIVRLLSRAGVLCRWRAGMTLDLADLALTADPGPDYEIVPWDQSRLREIAFCDFAAYRGSLDAALYWRYFETPAGCERMWREAMTGKFGRFDPDRSLLLLRQGRVCGCVMASVRLPQEAFIGDLAVSPEHRGGNGRALLLECLWRYQREGYRRVHLAVTLDNTHAFHLYQRLGFRVTSRFPIVTRPPARMLPGESGA